MPLLYRKKLSSIAINALQVQIQITTKSLPKNDSSKYKDWASRFTSCFSGVITIEATAILSLTLLVFCSLLYYFLVLGIQVELQAALDQAGLEAASNCYFLNQEVIQSSLTAQVIERAGRERIDHSTVSGGVSGLSFTDTKALETDSIIDLVLHYKVEIPFLPLPGLSFTQRSRQRAWVGDAALDSGSWGEGEGGTSQSYVYIAITGSVYHIYEDCSHLKLSTKTIQYGEIEGLRNEQGGRYYPCERCDANGLKGGAAYITSQGDRYHSRSTCSGLKRSILKIAMEDVGDRTLCLRCSNR